jgi:hypothetical protein
MEATKWRRWLTKTTGEKSTRAIARKVGVSHTTVQRWIAEGVPHARVWELTLRFHGDPVAACVVLGYVSPEDVRLFNYEKVVEYAPTVVLTNELHNRAVTTKREYPHIKLQRLTAELDAVV